MARPRKKNQHSSAPTGQSFASSFARPTLTTEDLSALPSIIEKHCRWPLRDFQIQALTALGRGEDVVVHAGTGSGKTAILAGLHLLPKTKGMVTLCSSPLIALQNEQVGVLFFFSFAFKDSFNASLLGNNHGGRIWH